jgi:hypothetical protein
MVLWQALAVLPRFFRGTSVNNLIGDLEAGEFFVGN